jgi:hypothetical protein
VLNDTLAKRNRGRVVLMIAPGSGVPAGVQASDGNPDDIEQSRELFPWSPFGELSSTARWAAHKGLPPCRSCRL